MDKTIIDVLYEENQKIDRFLEEHGEISLRKNVDNNFRKALLLSIASYFEHEIGEIILRAIPNQLWILLKTKLSSVSTILILIGTVKMLTNSLAYLEVALNNLCRRS